MWKYNYSDDQKDYLMHVNGFKYIAKIPFKKGFRYFYTKDEYNAYLNGDKITTSIQQPLQATAGINLTQRVRTFLNNKKDPALDRTPNFLDKGKSIFKDLTDTVEDKRKELEEARLKKREEEKRKAEEERKKAEEEKRKVEEEKKKTENRGGTEFLDKNLPLKDNMDATSDEDRKEINPNYNTGEYEYTNNCAYCTASWDLRRRGYDVEANPVPYPNPNTQEEILSWYQPTPEAHDSLEHFKDFARYNEDYDYLLADPVQVERTLTKDIAKQGDGARGTFLIWFAGGGGHSVAYEVRGDKVVLIDSQVNETINMRDYLQYAKNYTYFRTDNLTPSDKILKTCHSKNKH